MKERPILMSGPMVRALLAGHKTQTRLVVRLPHRNQLGKWEVLPWGGPNGGRTRDGATVPFQNVIGHSRTGEIFACPYGQPGDRLWVREAWMDLQGTGVEHRNADGMLQRYAYGADTPPGSYGDECRKGFGLRWRPSIHMPRDASRITLEVTGVRVERLHDISEADATAEGASAKHTVDANYTAREAYAVLWEQINGGGSWDANPWVWVINFKRAAAGQQGGAA